MSEIDDLMDRIRKNQPRLDRFELDDDDWELLLGEIERLRAQNGKLRDALGLTAPMEEV